MIPNWVRNALWVGVLAAGVWVALNIRGTLFIFGLAFLIAYLLNPVVRGLEVGTVRFLPPLKRLWAIVVVYLLLLGLLSGALAVLVPVANEQAGNIAQHLPDQVARLQVGVQGLWLQYLQRVPEDIRTKVEACAGNLTQQAATGLKFAFEKLTGFVGGFISGVFLVLTAMLISLYILMKWDGLLESTLGMVPEGFRDDAQGLGRQMNEIFGGYVRALIATSVVCGVATFVVLLLVSAIFGQSFPYTLILSLVAGITYGIPIVGILASTVLGALLAFVSTGQWGFTLAVTLGILGVNSLIDRTLFPKLTGEAMGVSELFVLFGAFAGGEILGIWGMLLGIPMAAMARALFTWFHGRFLLAPGEREAVLGEAPPAAAPAPEPAPEAAPPAEAPGAEPAVAPAPEAAPPAGAPARESDNTPPPPGPRRRDKG